jgi:hypothetical protein
MKPLLHSSKFFGGVAKAAFSLPYYAIVRMPPLSTPRTKYYPLLINSVLAGDLDSVRKEIADGHDLNITAGTGYDQTTALHVAMEVHGWSEMAKLLIESGANPNIKDACGRYPIECINIGGSVRLDKVQHEIDQIVLKRKTFGLASKLGLV